jgi:hypothetical protein
MPLINVSVGEIVDKMTILEIKKKKCQDVDKMSFIQIELDYIINILNDMHINSSDIDDLRLINAELWEVEDKIRICESKNDFGPNFIKLARNVYMMNDQRYLIKSKIDNQNNSDFREQKILPKYLKDKI